jgi:hypothetical protein
MKRLVAGALLVALLGAPSIAQAGTIRQAPAAVAEAPGGRAARSAPVHESPVEARDYAAREAAAPALGQFEGGDGAGIYIGGSALTIVLIVLLIVIIL